MRDGVETGFYVCDYSAKPNLATAPILKALADGMRRLEKTLALERETIDRSAEGT